MRHHTNTTAANKMACDHRRAGGAGLAFHAPIITLRDVQIAARHVPMIGSHRHRLCDP
jgi:hypothetical protein